VVWGKVKNERIRRVPIAKERLVVLVRESQIVFSGGASRHEGNGVKVR